MSNKEEKARQYSNKKVEEKDLYPFYSANTKRRLSTFDAYELEDAFEAGWDAATKEALYNSIWCRANGDYLPPKDKPVIVLIQHDYMERTEYAVSFAHIVDTSLYAGSKYIPEDYNGWNIPDVKYWLDLDLPKEE